MTFDLISGLHMQIQTWHPPLWLCTHAKYYVKSGLTNVLKNANKTKNMHLFSIRIANYEHQPSTLAAALELHIAPSSCISPLKRYLLLYHKLGKTINEPLKPPQYNMIFHAIVFLVNMVFSSGYCFLLLIVFSILNSLIFSCSLRSQTYI